MVKRINLSLQSIVTLSPERRYRFSVQIANTDQRNYLFWKYSSKFHPPISDEAMVRMYSESKISLGFFEVF